MSEQPTLNLADVPMTLVDNSRPPLYNGIDAAFPLVANAPADTQIVAGYIGGDAEHVWKPGEWNQFLPVFPSVRFLPIFVDDSHLFSNGRELGDAMCVAAMKRGWAPYQPNRRIIVVDAEENTDYQYYADASVEVWRLGFVMVQYRSSGSVGNSQQNPPELTWVAVPGQPKPSVMIWAGYQYHWQTGFDLNTFSQFVYDGCGVGERH